MLGAILLFLILYGLSAGLGSHIAAFMHIYIMLAGAALLPAIIGLQFVQDGLSSRIWAVFLDLLGEDNAEYGKVYALAIGVGFLQGFVVRMLRKPQRQ